MLEYFSSISMKFYNRKKNRSLSSPSPSSLLVYLMLAFMVNDDHHHHYHCHHMCNDSDDNDKNDKNFFFSSSSSFSNFQWRIFECYYLRIFFLHFLEIFFFLTFFFVKFRFHVWNVLLFCCCQVLFVYLFICGKKTKTKIILKFAIYASLSIIICFQISMYWRKKKLSVICLLLRIVGYFISIDLW